MGFSPLGLALSVALLAPNLVLLIARPRGPRPSTRVPTMLTVLERVGQALCVVVPAATLPGEVRWVWLAVVVVLLLAYLWVWVRYGRAHRDIDALYRPWGRVPVPGALFPVLAFFAGSLWLANPWIALAAAVLAAGHLPSALLIARDLGRRR